MTDHAREQDPEGEGAHEDDGGVVSGESPRVRAPPCSRGFAGPRRRLGAAFLTVVHQLGHDARGLGSSRHCDLLSDDDAAEAAISK
jgi:hypothetical protein